MRRLGLVLSAVTALAVAASCGGVVGRYAGWAGEKHRHFVREEQLVGPVVRGDPAFAGVHVDPDTAVGGVWMAGDVPSAADRERLQAALGRVVGEPRAVELMQYVHVSSR